MGWTILGNIGNRFDFIRIKIKTILSLHRPHANLLDIFQQRISSTFHNILFAMTQTQGRESLWKKKILKELEDEVSKEKL